MPDPPRSLILDQITTFGKANDPNSRSPGAGDSFVPAQDYQIAASYDTAHRTTTYDRNTDFAYGANPTSATVSSNTFYTAGSSSSANNTHDADTTNASYRLAGMSANATVVPNDVNLVSFASEVWPTTTGPYLDFAPQPVYEPTGELLHETTETFEKFDDPSSFRRPEWPSEKGKITTPQVQLAHEFGQSFPDTSIVANEDHIRPKSALKRSRESDVAADDTYPERRADQDFQSDPRKVRRVSFEQMSGTGPASADDEDSSSSEAPVSSRANLQARGGSGPRRGRGPATGAGSQSRSTTQQNLGPASQTRPPRGSKTPTGHPPSILPPEKVFPIQIGSELFRLSGASISSDAPSYFTQFFEEQIRQNEETGGVRTLYIDRDPETFHDIARHLQGYFIKPSDGSHFVKLFADAQFYSLPRLITQLFESEIFIQIGEKHFVIPKDVFSDPGNSPNFFSLGFAVFFSSPGEVFPGLDRRGLLRPPSITPPYVSGRSAEIFGQLLHLLRGYPLLIRNEEHRAELLRDCRYFHLRGLEQKIIAHDISFNLERQRSEICLRIEDIKPSGVSYKADESVGDQNTGGWVYYARPFVDDVSYELVIEIGGEASTVNISEMRADFHGLAKARVSSLFQVVANKMNLPTNGPLGLLMLSGSAQSPRTTSPGHTPLSEDRAKVLFEPASDIWLDGNRYEIDWDTSVGQTMRHGVSNLVEDDDDDEENSDAMSEVELEVEQDQPQNTRARDNAPNEVRPEASRTTASMQPQGRMQLTPSRVNASSGGSRKRRRPTVSSGSVGNANNNWVIRNGQWRLRVRQNKRDTARGGYEVVFVAVKVDAFSQERARNSRRSFLSGG